MKLFLFFLCILLLITTFGLFIYFDSKMRESRRQIIRLNNQFRKTKSNNKSDSPPNLNLNIMFVDKTYQLGVLSANTNILLAPIDSSPIINKIINDLEVLILDEAIVKDETWFYISLNLNDNNINSKGWVNKNSFSILYDSLEKLPKKI